MAKIADPATGGAARGRRQDPSPRGHGRRADTYGDDPDRSIAAHRRGTSASVRATDVAAGGIIRAGAVVVLAAMLGICVFLFRSAWPLLTGGGVESVETLGAPSGTEAEAAPALALIRGDLVMTLHTDGALKLNDPEMGWRGTVRPLGAGVEVAAAHSDPSSGVVTVVTAAGGITQGTITSAVAPLRASRLPDRIRELPPGTRLDSFEGDEARAIETAARASGLEGEVALIWRTPVSERAGSDAGPNGGEGGWWARTVTAELAEPVAVEGLGSRARSVVAAEAGAGRRVAAVLTESGAAVGVTLRERRSFVGGVNLSASSRALTIPDLAAGDGAAPGWLIPLPAGASYVALWRDGSAARIGTGDSTVLERTNLAPTEPGTAGDTPAGRVTAAALALGGRTLLIGRGDGMAEAWLLANPGEDDATEGADADRLVRAHRARLGSAAITAIAPAQQGRTAAFGFADGSLVLWNATSEKLVARVPGGEGASAVRVAARAPDLRLAAAWREDGIATVARIDSAHPGASWVSLFAPVHYESYDEPTFVYQAEGSAGAEPKLSLVPLIWGTLKATAVSMFISVPLAILAALYTSEFMHPNARRAIKPVIELMASLPSVVLGFIAAMVVAPWVRDHLTATIVWPLAAPAAVVLGAQAWRAVPAHVSRRVRTVTRLGLVAVAVVAGTSMAYALGPAIESVLFAGEGGPGSLRVWLDRDPTVRPESWREGAWPGWLLALLIPAAIVVVAFEGRVLGAWWAARHAGDGPRAAGVGVARSLWRLALTVALAGLGGLVLASLGFDPRETIFGSGSPPNFFQRNTLVVGIVMGFAVIPIIYTISEDAMRAVPEGLRAASLGCGATPWQTATRVVLPVAGSGVFSACMVGLGRAVGETMIVLMATGNTPLMEWNIFSGVRTLAANIAVELPEAARGGTHYRVLFLCGLVLFLMTLLVNTTAELVRQRFRKRSAAL